MRMKKEVVSGCARDVKEVRQFGKGKRKDNEWENNEIRKLIRKMGASYKAVKEYQEIIQEVKTTARGRCWLEIG